MPDYWRAKGLLQQGKVRHVTTTADRLYFEVQGSRKLHSVIFYRESGEYECSCVHGSKHRFNKEGWRVKKDEQGRPILNSKGEEQRYYVPRPGICYHAYAVRILLKKIQKRAHDGNMERDLADDRNESNRPEQGAAIPQ